MDIAIRKGNVDLTPRMRQAVEEKVSRLVRFLDGVTRAEVHFTEERNPRIAEKDHCELCLVDSHGMVVRAKAVGVDPVAALDRAVDKCEHRVEKAKRRYVRRPHHRTGRGVSSAIDGRARRGAAAVDSEADLDLDG